MCGSEWKLCITHGRLVPDKSMLLVSFGWPHEKAGYDSQKLQVSAMQELPARLLIHIWNSSVWSLCLYSYSSWSSWMNSCMSARVVTYLWIAFNQALAQAPVADLEFWKGGFQYAIKGHVACLLGGSGGMPPPKENFGFLTFWDHFWCILGVKL